MSYPRALLWFLENRHSPSSEGTSEAFGLARYGASRARLKRDAFSVHSPAKRPPPNPDDSLPAFWDCGRYYTDFSTLLLFPFECFSVISSIFCDRTSFVPSFASPVLYHLALSATFSFPPLWRLLPAVWPAAPARSWFQRF